MKKIFLCLFVFFLSSVFLFAESWGEEGLASWYGGKFNGRKTASGEIFNTDRMTAAHKTLPFGTLVKVTNKKNGKSIEVRINDRGPFVEGRIIDLSRAGMAALGGLKDGVIPVEVKSLTEVKSGYGRVSLQVGAYSQEKYARVLLDKLKFYGYYAELEKTETGMIRVVLKGIPQDKSEKLKVKLEQIGIGRADQFVERQEGV